MRRQEKRSKLYRISSTFVARLEYLTSTTSGPSFYRIGVGVFSNRKAKLLRNLTSEKGLRRDSLK